MFQVSDPGLVRCPGNRPTNPRIFGVLLAIALPLALSDCHNPLVSELAKEALKGIVSKAAVLIAQPVMEAGIKKIYKGLGVKDASAAMISDTVKAGVMQEWQQAHATYPCADHRTAEDCENAARSDAEQLAQTHAEHFQQVYAACEKDVLEHGRGGFLQSVKEINACTARNGFAAEINTIIRLASGQ